jgi:hypothetical protein
LEKRGFGGKWLSWIRKILTSDSIGVTVNNVEGEFFQTGKGLRPGLQKSAESGGIGPVRIPKPSNLLFTVSKFQKKIKVSKKYVKK